jgi:hypothetical protein
VQPDATLEVGVYRMPSRAHDRCQYQVWEPPSWRRVGGAVPSAGA